MRRPAIFISHSAHEPEASAAVDALCAFLDLRGFTVLLDRERLKGGDVWEQQIRHWLDVCRGAVVLISPSALASDWVHTEASILLQRARRASGFCVIPLRVGGVEPSAVAESALHSTGLPSLQAEAWPPGESVPASVEQAFAPLLRDADDRSPTYRLELALGEKLGALRTATIIQTGRCLDLELDTYEHDQDPVASLALGLMEAKHDVQVKACTEMAELVNVDVGAKVYSWISPRSWVAPAATARLRAVARADGRRWLGVHAGAAETYDMCVRSGYFRWKLVRISIRGEDAAAELLQELATLVAVSLGYDPDEPFDIEELNRELAEDPRFVLLPDPPPPVAALEEVARRLSNLVLVVRCRQDGEAVPSSVTILEPIDPERETQLVRAHRALDRKLKAMREDQRW